MKVLLVASTSPLSDALLHWFALRERDVRLLSPRDIPTLQASDLYNSLIIEVASLESMQWAGDLALTGEERHHLVELAERCDCPFIFLSDGRVFDGESMPMNHRETETVQPGSQAGGRLSAIEHLLARHLHRHLILRTGPLFSENGENFFTDLFNQLRAGKEIGLNSVLKTCPTHINDLARVLSGVVDQVSCGAENWGIYHYNSSGLTNTYEFAEVILAFASQQLDLFGKNVHLVVNEAGYRIEPAVPALRCEKIFHHFGIKQLPWRSYLPKPIKILCEKA